MVRKKIPEERTKKGEKKRKKKESGRRAQLTKF